jgi:uncharacterized protein YdiU (UPF0061 family)
LVRLANAIYPLTEDAPPLEAALGQYVETFQQEYRSTMAAKLGLRAFDPATDMEMFNELLTILQLIETDMTIFYRKLARLPITEPALAEDRLTPLLDAYYDPAALTAEYRDRMGNWLDQYGSRVRRDGTSDAERAEWMNAVNPKYVLRNYLAQLAIDQAESGDYSLVNDLLQLLRRPYDEQPEQETFAAKRPDWARQRAGCSMLSCSS